MYSTLKKDIMMLHVWAISILLVILCSNPTDCKVHKGASECWAYNRRDCENGGSCDPYLQNCSDLSGTDGAEHHLMCYATWTMSNATDILLEMKGCWMNDAACKNKKECVETDPGESVQFCCCDEAGCNQEFFYRPEKDKMPKAPSTVTTDVTRQTDNQQLTNTILYSIVPIIGVGLLVVVVYTLWRHHQSHMGHTQLPTTDPHSLGPTPSQSTLNLQLLELKARGRYGSIWKAQMPNQFVAVKIFPLQDKHSWRAELDIYNLPHMKHENILTFIASDKRDESLCTELWLITEFHEQGSLCDYLKGNTISWAQLCRIGESMTCGLAYLHDEIPATSNSPAKPAIAHRDFKSKNVLLKADLTAVIADFGLALMFEPGKAFSETHTQVGTRRYMAPEVLEGAICFNRDSFLRIDMYACGLVIWELMTRCTVQDGPFGEYRLPFEAEVGLQPTLEEMQTLVVNNKIRPAFYHTWIQHTGMNSLVATVEECWDQDAEARLSAGCVQERISHMSRNINSGNNGVGAPPPDMMSLPQSTAPQQPPPPPPPPAMVQSPPYIQHIADVPSNRMAPLHSSHFPAHIHTNYTGVDYPVAPPSDYLSNYITPPSFVPNTAVIDTVSLPHHTHRMDNDSLPEEYTHIDTVTLPEAQSIVLPPSVNSC